MPADPGGALARGGSSARRAIERLFATLLPPLARWAHARLPRHARRRCDTWDLVQDACSAAVTHLQDLESRPPAQVYLYLRQCIRNRVRDEIRRSRLGEIASSEGLVAPDPRPSALEEACESEDRLRFRRALVGLDAEDRELIVGRVELELSYEELALATGRVSPEAARAATRRAMLRLAREIGGPARSG
ncbi:MAG: sigma-70 family RNA polymerase sigma factor [Thermoanaerobaculia bacterium]